MKKLLLVLMAVLMSTLFIACDDSSDDNDNGNGNSVTQDQVSASVCNKMKTCKTPMYESIKDQCETMVGQQYFADCKNYDANSGGQCVKALETMSCDDYNDAIAKATPPSNDPSGMPVSCQHESICPAK